MAETEAQAPPPQPQVGEKVQEKETAMPSTPSLKYLGFVQVAVIRVIAYVTTLYESAKDSSGPLKPGVDSVEGTVKTVVGPVYQKIEGKPLELLRFVDGKVDDIFHLLDDVLPELVKEKSYEVVDVAKNAPDFARSVLSEVQKRGVINTAKGLFDQYEPIAEAYGIKAWKTALGLPLVPQAVGVVRSVGVKANHVIINLKDSQLPLASYLPLLPLNYFDKLTKVE
ncbi:hypothetical protein Mapa_000313 [Marchantia paleacea]|nr:hypothetical protein Mapa_000313 [Marchantia paleacea]